MIYNAERIYAPLDPHPFFHEARYFVNGQNGAHNLLWAEWEQREKKNIKTWEQVQGGVSVRVGSVAGEDLRYTFFFSRINGHLVGFYHSERLLTDMKLIEAWLDKTPAGKANRTCNAINFGSCILEIS